MENVNDNSGCVVLKRDEKLKKESGTGSCSKGTKERFLGSLHKRRESLGNKLFPKDASSVEKKSPSVPAKEQSPPVLKVPVAETMISFLLSKKANVNACDSYGSTPLHYAVAKGNPEAVKELLRHPDVDIEVRTELKRQLTLSLRTLP